VDTDLSTLPVGVEIMAGEECDALIEAASKDNRGLHCLEFPSFVRVECPGRLVFNRTTVEECLGRAWNTKDLNQVVSAFHGYFTEWDEDRVILSWTFPDGDRHAG
jgi:phenol/toluene 2-monooxygenase (NADH) P2/A2